RLMAEWSRARPFPVRLINPEILREGAPSGGDLVAYDERRYADFCRRFEAAATCEVLRSDPARTVILVNDISEGPDFARLAAAGFPIVTIYHVDVVAYVAAIYGRGWIAPATLVRWYEKLRSRVDSWIPAMARLVFDKQRDSLHYSKAVVVPSQ